MPSDPERNTWQSTRLGWRRPQRRPECAGQAHRGHPHLGDPRPSRACPARGQVVDGDAAACQPASRSHPRSSWTSSVVTTSACLSPAFR